MRRIVIVLSALALAGCGTTTATPHTQLPVISTTSIPTPTTNGPDSTTTTAPPATTTTSAVSTTIAAAPLTTASTGIPVTTAPSGTMVVAPYFYIDEAGHPARTGPFVVPVAREVDRTVAAARATVEQLLSGPTVGEGQGVPAITTAIPDGVRLLGLSIDEDTATIDLSSEFGATDSSPSVAQRAAQIVFTLARFDSVAEVLFRQDGKAVSIQTGDGSIVNRPVGIHDYLEFAAALSVESPVYAGPGGNPLRVTGFGAAFEATFQYVLTDADGLILEEGVAMTNNGTGWGGFDFTIEYDVDRRQVGALVVWVNSAQDGSRIDAREYPVVLTP